MLGIHCPSCPRAWWTEVSTPLPTTSPAASLVSGQTCWRAALWLVALACCPGSSMSLPARPRMLRASHPCCVTLVLSPLPSFPHSLSTMALTLALPPVHLWWSWLPRCSAIGAAQSIPCLPCCSAAGSLQRRPQLG